MAERLMSGLVILTGLLCTWVGFAMASSRVRTAGRAYRKTAALSTTHPEGWHGWFLDAFSGVSLGMRWLAAVVTWAGWTLAGVGLIVLGIRAFS